MSTSRKATLFFLVALVCVSSQFVSHAATIEPEVASALQMCSSLEQCARWISELTGETEASIRGKSHLILTRYAPSEGARTAEQYLREQFRAMALEVDTHGVPGFSSNLIARLPGITRPEEAVIICAHYDSISEDPYNRAPGANDNASGTAGVLAAASMLRNFRLDRSVEFCLFTAEELGLYGSQAYAAECSAAGKTIVGVICMDVIIHPGDARDVNIWTNKESQKLAGTVRTSMETYASVDVKVRVDTTQASDHASFWDIGSDALLVCTSSDPEVKHTTGDLITQPNVDLAFGLLVARGVAAAAMTLAEWEPSWSLPVGATTYAEVDGTAGFDAGENRASTSVTEGLAPDGAVAESHAENLVLQGTANAWAGRQHEAICHSTSFETFVPRSSTLPEGRQVCLELMIQGSGQFAIKGKLGNLYANCRVEAWARSVESLRLFDGSVSLSWERTEISGDFSSDAFSLYSAGTREEATLSQWNDVISFNGKVGQPITLCARLSQMAYSRGGGQAECAWTEPIRLAVTSATPGVWLEIAGFTDEPRVSQISTDGADLAIAWQPFSQGQYTVEHSEDLISWTPIATTPFTAWRTDDWASGVGFFRVRSE